MVGIFAVMWIAERASSAAKASEELRAAAVREAAVTIFMSIVNTCS
jgi:hypothetical protein